MAKKRVHEIAKAQGVSSKELLAALKAAGIEAKAAASSVEEADALKAIAAAKGNGGASEGSREESRCPKRPSRRAKAAPAAKPDSTSSKPVRPAEKTPLPRRRPAAVGPPGKNAVS